MANLETLELTIKSNASSASRGLTKLINSLSALSSALVKPYSDLRDFNEELQKLANNAKIKLNITGKVGGSSVLSSVKKQTEALNENAKASKTWAETQVEANPDKFSNYKTRGNQAFKYKMLLPEETKQTTEGTIKAADALKQVSQNAAEAKAEVQDTIQEIKEIETASKESSKSQMTFGQRIKQAAVNLKDAIPKFNMLHRVLRLASTMLIRMGLRALFKGMKEGLNNYYLYSKKIGGTFSEDMNNVYSAWTKLKNQMGASIAPILSAALPVINSIANAAVHAFNAISQLFALLSGKNSWSAATEQAMDYGDAIGGASGKTKELLAQFDELNVIASESGGGGGGGAAGDVANMFEEMYEFDEKIRALVDFIKNNMTSIKGIVIAIGTAILAWKLADAFADTLPLLSKIFGYVAAGAVVAITLQVTWMLTNQYLNTNDEGWLIADIFTTAIGATAAASIAQHFIGGNAGAWTAAITLAFSAITGIKALLDRPDIDALSEQSIKTSVVEALKMGAAGTILFIAGGAGIGTALAGGAVIALATFGVAIGIKAFVNYLSSDGLEWGSVQLTQQQVQDFVNQKMFKIDVSTSIERINATIESTAVNKTELREKLSALIGELNVIKLGVDNDYTGLKVAVNAVIATVEKYIKDAKEMGKLTLQLTPTLVGNDESEQGDWFTSYTTGWDYVDNWFKTKGEELGNLLVENEQGVIVSNGTKQKLIQALSEQLAEVTAAISKAEINSAAYAGMASGIGDLTQASASDVLEAFAKYKEDLTTAYTDLVNEQYTKQGELVAALFAIDPESEEYKKALADYEEMGKNIPKAIEDGVDAASESGYNLIKEWLSGIDLNMDMTTAEWKQLIDNMGGSLDAAIEEAVNAATGDPKVLEAAKLVGMTGWDLLTDDLKKNFLASLTLDDATIAQLKQIGISASDLIKFSGWDTFSANEKLNFLNAIADAFGSDAALAAAKEAGINVATLLEDGLRHSDTEGVAKELIEKFGAEVNKGEVTVPDVSTPKGFFDKVLEGAKTGVNAESTYLKENPVTAPKVQKKDEIFDNVLKGATDGVKAEQKYLKNNPVTAPKVKKKDEIFDNVMKGATDGVKAEGKYLKNNPVTSPKVKKADGFFDNVSNGAKTGIESTQRTLNKSDLTVPKLKTAKEFSSDVTSALSDVIGNLQETADANPVKIPVGVKSDGSSVTTHISGGGTGPATVTVMAKAMGGLVKTGSLFLAGEAGPELVGTINGQTGVANQNQIVDGIRKGVSDAQSEQNALLRQQNDLLRAILAKDGNLKASAALGRIASQSINMYNGLVGG